MTLSQIFVSRSWRKSNRRITSSMEGNDDGKDVRSSHNFIPAGRMDGHFLQPLECASVYGYCGVATDKYTGDCSQSDRYGERAVDIDKGNSSSDHRCQCGGKLYRPPRSELALRARHCLSSADPC